MSKPTLTSISALYYLPPFLRGYLRIGGILSLLLNMQGLIDGLLLASLIVTIWSWYSMKELSLRLLIWTFLGDRIRGWTGLALIYQPFDALRFLRYQPFVVVMVMISTALFLLPTTIGKDIIGRPVEVSWLAAHQKIFLARHAATSKYVLKDMMGIQQPRQVSAAMNEVVTILMILPVHHYAMRSTIIILRNLFNDNPRFS